MLLPIEFALIIPSYRCNLRCLMCGLGSLDSDSLDQVDFSALKEFGIQSICVGGGEPLLFWRKTQEIIKAAQSSGFEVSVVSNGLLIREVLEKYNFISALDRLVVSLDGPPEIHDLIRGCGTFEIVVAGIRALLKSRGPHSGNVVVNMTVSRYNCHALIETAEIVRALGVDHFEIQPVLFFGNEFALQNLPKDKSLLIPEGPALSIF